MSGAARADDAEAARKRRNKAALHRRRLSAGLCQDCAQPREGEGATRHRCPPCAARVAAEKRARRLLADLAVAFGVLADETIASRTPTRRALRFAKRGRERMLRVEGSSREIAHGDLLVALLLALGVEARRPPRRR